MLSAVAFSGVSSTIPANLERQNLYVTARYVMIGCAFSSALLSPSRVPSTALMMTDDVVFNGIYVTDAVTPQCWVML